MLAHGRAPAQGFARIGQFGRQAVQGKVGSPFQQKLYDLGEAGAAR